MSQESMFFEEEAARINNTFNISKWDHRFVNLAKHCSGWSKDPSTQVGSVIVRPNKSIASIGFNGFPQGVDDSEERYLDREVKYDIIVHAEVNALMFCREDMVGYTLYTWPLLPCCRCAGLVIQSGIKRVVAPTLSEELRVRWEKPLNTTKEMFEEAGVEWFEIGV